MTKFDENGADIILLNEAFYNTLNEEDPRVRAAMSDEVLKAAKEIEDEGTYPFWIPLLYTIMARCYFALDDMEKAIVYSRDALFLGEANTDGDIMEHYESIDAYNLHPLKTQRDLAMSLSDFPKAIELQKRIQEVTPYLDDEQVIMEGLTTLQNSDKIPKLPLGKTYDDFCSEYKWKTPEREKMESKD